MNRKNTSKKVATILCVLIIATVVPFGALAGGACTYRDPSTNVACSKSTTREVIGISPVYNGSHTYYNEDLGCEALCNYTYCYITEADVCSDYHETNAYTYLHDHGDHACKNAGR